MSSTVRLESIQIPMEVNYVAEGHGTPVVLIHGLAASLHDWDALTPDLVAAGYATYALDLLGHGDSPKPAVSAYEMDWMVDHFVGWLNGLNLKERPILVGHSLGGYVALEYARRFPDRLRGLVLVDPFYANSQLPAALRLAYAHPAISSFFMGHTPSWLIRWAIDVTSVMMGHSKGGLHALPADVREQTALDYMRTSPATYAILRVELDLKPYLASIQVPTLVVWGERDRTLAPASFRDLVRWLPQAMGASRATGHVPHQAEAKWFNEQVLAFLQSLGKVDAHDAAGESRELGGKSA